MHVIRASSLALALVATLAPAGTAEACTCAAGSDEEWVAWADEVFVGRVDSIAERSMRVEEGYGWPGGSRRATLTAERWWKGRRGRALSVWTGSGGGDCGAGFVVGRRYLVLAVEVER